MIRLLEYRGNKKSAVELNKLVADMLDNETHQLSFIELACHVFEKPYRRFIFHSDSVRDAAYEEALAQANDPEAARARFLILQEVEKESVARKKSEEMVKECVGENVASKAEFFKKKMTVDEKKTIEMKVIVSFYRPSI